MTSSEEKISNIMFIVVYLYLFAIDNNIAVFIFAIVWDLCYFLSKYSLIGVFYAELILITKKVPITNQI